MTSVVLRSGESQESLLRRFRRRVQRSGILGEAKRHRHFIKDSEKRRIARRKAVRRERRRLAKARRRHRRYS